MLFFLLGAALGALALFWVGVKARALADRMEEEKYQPSEKAAPAETPAPAEKP